MKVAPSLLSLWQRSPKEVFKLILRVSGDLEETDARLRESGIQVRRRCKLIHGFAIECTGALAEAIAKEPWVTSVEADAPVRGWPLSK